jgi:hypothetical protein
MMKRNPSTESFIEIFQSFRHIKAHLEDKLELGEKKMSPEEERYHYFSMNDLNKVCPMFVKVCFPLPIKDNVIDGIEVWKAIHHNHDHHGKLEGPPATPLSDEEVEKSVDDVMKDIDLNGDGAIDYSEYIKKVEL